MVPVGIVAECVAIKSGLTEIVQTVEILRCELVVSELVVSKLIVAKLIVAKLIVGGERVVTSVCEIVTGNPPSMTGHCVVVTEIMGSVTAAAHDVRVRPAVSARCMATPPMTHVGQATVGKSAAMPATASTVISSSKPTAPAVKSTASAVKSTASTSASAFAAPGDCRSVRDDAKRANRNACRQNAYRSLRHGTLPIRNSKAVGVAARATTARTSPHLDLLTAMSAA